MEHVVVLQHASAGHTLSADRQCRRPGHGPRRSHRPAEHYLAGLCLAWFIALSPAPPCFHSIFSQFRLHSRNLPRYVFNGENSWVEVFGFLHS